MVGHTFFNNKKFTIHHANSKPISDYRFRYTTFTNKLHDHTPFKNPITYSGLFTFHFITFNPDHKTYKLIHSSGAHFHVPVCLSFYFVKRVKPKSTAINLVNAQQNSLTIRDLYPFIPYSLLTIYKNHLISFKMCYDHTSIFNQLTISFNICFQVTPYCQYVPDLDNLTRFVSLFSYD